MDKDAPPTVKLGPLVEFSHPNIHADDGPRKPRRLPNHSNLLAWGAGSEARCVIVPLQLVEPLFELGFFRSYFLIDLKSHCFMKFP